MSNLPFLSKVVERAVADHLQAFLEDSYILDSFHSGFCSDHEIEIIPVALMGTWHLDQGRPTLLQD